MRSSERESRVTPGFEDWEAILSRSIRTPAQLASCLRVVEGEVEEVVRRYPMGINPYYLGLIEGEGDAIFRQAVPDLREITARDGYEDPLEEETLSPVPGLTHRYPDRVLLLVSGRCAMYCRFCNRKRKVGRSAVVTEDSIREGLSYIRHHRQVRDVLLSGGDPLILSDDALRRILTALRAIPHVEIIRIGTRVPCTLPQRVTPGLVDMLRGFQPLYVNTHFNHPSEITPLSALACGRLADAGIPLGCQTVLLKGVNDDREVMKRLMQRLLAVRVRPYYLFQADLARGTSHFWTPLSKGLEIMAALQGHISGLCIPRFMIDLPGGGGKIPLTPEYVVKRGEDHLVVRNYRGREYRYPLA